MATLESILFFVIVSSLLGLSGGLILIAHKKFAQKFSFYLVGFAAGALLATAFLDLLPESLEIANSEMIFVYTLIGIIVFFLIEKLLIWHHHHAYEKKEFHPYNYMIIVGDAIHNFIDGIIIAGTFLVSPALGIPTFLAVIFHEIPQEISDFSILLHGKMKRKKIVIVNILSALSSVLGAILAYYLFSAIEGFLIGLIAFAAGAFIYIAASDLIPETIKERKTSRSILQIVLLILGVLVIWATGQILAH